MSQPTAPLRVLIVSYHFAPANESGTHRAIHFARSLHNAGHDVHVLTGRPPDTGQFDEALVRVFPYQNRIVRVAEQDSPPARMITGLRALLPVATGARTVPNSGQRTDASQSHRTGLMAWPSKVYNEYESYPDIHRGWLKPALRAGGRLVEQSRFDVVVATGPPWTALRVGARLADASDARFVADFRDPWASGTGVVRAPSVIARLTRRLESRVLNAADLILFNSGALAAGSGLTSTTRVVTVLNGSEMPRNTDRQVFLPDQHLTFRHFGTLYGDRSLRPLLEAINGTEWPDGLFPIVEQFGSVLGSDLLGGSGKRVQSRPAVPFSQVIEEMNRAAILVVVQPEQFRHQIPTKTYDYLCTGNPILVLASEQSSVWSLAGRFKRCVRADPTNPAEINRVVRDLLEQWQAGTLTKVPADVDTDWLRKSTLNTAFVAEIERLCETE